MAYARSNNAVILYDAAYEAFIEDRELPRSIFQIEGSKECAIELCSLSKTAGFTGTRCGYTVVPLALKRKTKSGKELSLNKMWLRRQTTKFNGVPYVVQRAAEAVFTPEGQKQCRANLAYYKEDEVLGVFRFPAGEAGHCRYAGFRLRQPGGRLVPPDRLC